MAETVEPKRPAAPYFTGEEYHAFITKQQGLDPAALIQCWLAAHMKLEKRTVVLMADPSMDKVTRNWIYLCALGGVPFCELQKIPGFPSEERVAFWESFQKSRDEEKQETIEKLRQEKDQLREQNKVLLEENQILKKERKISIETVGLEKESRLAVMQKDLEETWRELQRETEMRSAWTLEAFEKKLSSLEADVVQRVSEKLEAMYREADKISENRAAAIRQVDVVSEKASKGKKLPAIEGHEVGPFFPSKKENSFFHRYQRRRLHRKFLAILRQKDLDVDQKEALAEGFSRGMALADLQSVAYPEYTPEQMRRMLRLLEASENLITGSTKGGETK